MWILTTTAVTETEGVDIVMSLPLGRTHPQQQLVMLREYTSQLRARMYQPVVVWIYDGNDGSAARKLGEALLQQCKLADADADVHLVGVESLELLPTRTTESDESECESCAWCDLCATCGECSGEHYDHAGHSACENCYQCTGDCDDCRCAWCYDCEELYSEGHVTCETCGNCSESEPVHDKAEGS